MKTPRFTYCANRQKVFMVSNQRSYHHQVLDVVAPAPWNEYALKAAWSSSSPPSSRWSRSSNPPSSRWPCLEDLDLVATSRAYRRADSETQEAINSVLVLLPKCDSREPDVEDCRSACHQSCFRFSLSQNNDCKFSPAQAAFCTSSKTSPNNHLVKEKCTLSKHNCHNLCVSRVV